MVLCADTLLQQKKLDMYWNTLFNL